MNQRRKLLQGIAAGGLSAWMSALLAADGLPVQQGLRRVQGEVWINGTRARPGQLVRGDDTVSTGAGSEAVFVMGDNAYLLRDRGRVSFLGQGAQSVMRVISGKLLSVFGRRRRRILTSTAVIGIRGTGCYIEAQQDLVYFCLCYGSADVQPLADPRQARSLITQHHDSPFYIGSDASGPLIRPASVTNHTDAELILLEHAVGREPPFQGESSY